VLLDASLEGARRVGRRRGPRGVRAGRAAPAPLLRPRPGQRGIVTCGGLCPGLNDVIRAIVMSLPPPLRVSRVIGFQYGYEGLVASFGHARLELTPARVSRIHEMGGTVLGSSRGNQDVGEMVDTLERERIDILFTIGGDGTLRGAHAIAEEVARRGAI